MQFDSISLARNSHDSTKCMVQVLHIHISASDNTLFIYFLLTFTQSSMQRKSECTEEEKKKKGKKLPLISNNLPCIRLLPTLQQVVLSSLASYKK